MLFFINCMVIKNLKINFYICICEILIDGINYVMVNFLFLILVLIIFIKKLSVFNFKDS